MHLFMNPLIKVSGAAAKGHWYLLCPLTIHEGNRATWCAGRYFEEYVKLNGEWKYDLLRFTPYFITPFDKGQKRNLYFDDISQLAFSSFDGHSQ
jgi:hypothetical protein